jgi:hypothetical protein
MDAKARRSTMPWFALKSGVAALFVLEAMCFEIVRKKIIGISL